jgi:DNA polymerase III subunit delta
VDYAGFVKAADAGRLPPVTLLHGSEPFLLDDALVRLTRALFPGQSELSLVREVFDARAAGAEAIVQSALMLPWLGERRLVIARGIDGLAAKAGEPLAAYAKTPNPSTALVLVADAPLEGGHWLLRAVPPAAVVAAPAPSGRALAGWLRTHAQGLGYDLREDAATLLVELSGDDLTQLVGEVEKAALAGGPDNRRVGTAEVRAVVGEHRLRHVFDLTRALTARDTGTALALLESLLNAGEEPLAVLGMLAREARATWQAAGALRAGRPAEEIARALRRPPAAATALLERARGLSPATAARQVARCWDVERRLKQGGAARPELSLLVSDLCAV